MFHGIKRIFDMNKRAKDINSEYDEDGKLLLKMTVRDDSNFISAFSCGDEEILSQDVSEFLQDSMRPKDCKKPLHLKVYSDVIDDSEKKRYTLAIHNTFCKKYIKERQKMTRDFLLSIMMLIFGVALLALMVLIDSFGYDSIWLEVIDIFAWVFLWEAADIFFLERYVSKYKMHMNISFSTAKITFCDMEKR